MNISRTIVAVIALSWMNLSCSNDPIADDVYKMHNPVEEKLSYGLSVTVKEAQETGKYLLAVRTTSLFNSRGEVESNLKEAFLFTVPFKGNRAEITDLKAYRNDVLFLNVLQKKGEELLLSTHTGSELKYQPVFGLQQKTIDLSTAPEVSVKQTLVKISMPEVYVGKEVFLVPSEKVEAFETHIKGGAPIAQKDYGKIESNATVISHYIPTPHHDTKYTLYIINPNSELPFIPRSFTVPTDSKAVDVIVKEEKKKTINVSIMRGEETYDKAEVYLIDAEKWQEVDNQISKNHGNPEKGSYLFKQVAYNGRTSFEMYHTIGRRDLVVLVPKWNSTYYDSYEMREVAINSQTDSYDVEVKAEFNPSTGHTGITKEVTFNVSINRPEGYRYFWSNIAYVIRDSENIAQVWRGITSGEDIKALATEGIIPTGADKVSITSEIETSKEIAILVPVMKGFSFAPLIKRIKGADLKGDSIEITVSTLENIQ